MSLKNSIKILIVDDDLIVRDSMGNWLQEEGYKVDTIDNGHDGLEKIKTDSYDLAVVDIKMPGMDGIELLKLSKEIYPDLPILVMTAYASVDTAVQAMKDGAFDYIVKPFSATEVLARVRAVLRRAQVTGSSYEQSIFTHGNLRIDLARAEVFKDEDMVFLSATEYRLLLQFVHNQGNILTSEDLLVNVWGPEYREDKEILWVSISRLRQKLEDDPRNPQHIVTRSGMGYTMPPLQ